MTRDISTKELYINPFTDFGFKKLFGEEANKDLLEDFLRELLKNEAIEIKNITFLKNENIQLEKAYKKGFLDLCCENEKGKRYIVEIQQSKYNFFKDKLGLLLSFPIQEYVNQEDHTSEFKQIYTIAILDFIFEEDKKETDKFLYRVKLSDIETKKVFYDKLTFVYVEMPKFNKTIDECETHFDKWLYVIKNLPRLERIPDKLKEKIFSKLFKEAEIANLKPAQVREYEESLKTYRDLHSILETTRIEGERIGIEKGEHQKALEIAKNLLDILDNKTISQKTGLSIEQIEKLRNKSQK